MDENPINETNPDLEELGLEDNEALDVLEFTLDKLLDVANVDQVYGEPLQQGNATIIPAAEVLAAVGMGVGSGRGEGPSTGEEGKPSGGGGSGSGGGAGGRSLARPVAVVISDQNGVRVEPVLDVTKVALAALTAGGFMIGMIARMNRRRWRNE
jgi:uncharacterized spore protein YtfJ